MGGLGIKGLFRIGITIILCFTLQSLLLDAGQINNRLNLPRRTYVSKSRFNLKQDARHFCKFALYVVSCVSVSIFHRIVISHNRTQIHFV